MDLRNCSSAGFAVTVGTDFSTDRDEA
jgi:hypothetical protein